MERLIKEVRRRTKVVSSFPDGNSALMLVAARLRHVTGSNETEALSGYESPEGTRCKANSPANNALNLCPGLSPATPSCARENPLKPQKQKQYQDLPERP